MWSGAVSEVPTPTTADSTCCAASLVPASAPTRTGLWASAGPKGVGGGGGRALNFRVGVSGFKVQGFTF